MMDRKQVRAQEIQVTKEGCCREHDPVNGDWCKVKAKEADAIGRTYTACSIDGGRCRVEAKEADAVERA